MSPSQIASVVLIGAVEAALWLWMGWNSALLMLTAGNIIVAGWSFDDWRIRRNASALAVLVTLVVVVVVGFDFSIAGWLLVALLLVSGVMATIGLSSSEYRRTRGLE